MPNIEIHGLASAEAGAMEIKIRKLFQDAPYSREIVITTIPSTVVDLQGRSQPFFRLYVTLEDNYVQEVIDCLARLGVDMEVSVLYKFIPAEKEDDSPE